MLGSYFILLTRKIKLSLRVLLITYYPMQESTIDGNLYN